MMGVWQWVIAAREYWRYARIFSRTTHVRTASPRNIPIQQPQDATELPPSGIIPKFLAAVPTGPAFAPNSAFLCPYRPLTSHLHLYEFTHMTTHFALVKLAGRANYSAKHVPQVPILRLPLDGKNESPPHRHGATAARGPGVCKPHLLIFWGRGVPRDLCPLGLTQSCSLYSVRVVSALLLHLFLFVMTRREWLLLMCLILTQPGLRQKPSNQPGRTR